MCFQSSLSKLKRVDSLRGDRGSLFQKKWTAEGIFINVQINLGAGGCSSVFGPAEVVAAGPSSAHRWALLSLCASSAKKQRASESSSLWWFSSFPQLPLLMGERFLVLPPSVCSLSSLVARPWQLLAQKSCTCRVCQGPIGSWELLVCVLPVTFLYSYGHTSIWILACPEHGTLLVPRSSPCVFHAA